MVTNIAAIFIINGYPFSKCVAWVLGVEKFAED